MPKIVDHEERRARIVRAMVDVIVRDDFTGVTMREIAAAAGYAHGAISRYFPNKQALLVAAFTHLFTEGNYRVADETRELRGLTALEAICRSTLPFGEAGRENARVVTAFWSYTDLDPQLRELQRSNYLKWRELYRKVLMEAREDGELDEASEIEAAINVITLRSVGWQMHTKLLPEQTTDAAIEADLQSMLTELRGRRQK